MAAVSPMAEIPAAEGMEKVVCPPDRHIPIPVHDLVESLMSHLEDNTLPQFAALAKLIEATCQCEYLEIRSRLKRDFLPFSAAAGRHPLTLQVGKELPSDEYLDREELEFVSGFDALMDAAHYNRLSRQEWETAEQEEFTFMMPVEVDWSRNDTNLLTRFWESRGEKDREEAAEIADRILVYHRGFDKGNVRTQLSHLWQVIAQGLAAATASGLYIVEKIDLLVAYLVAVPIAHWLGAYFPNSSLLQALQKVGDGMQKAHYEQYADDPVLQHKHAKVIFRSSLERQMPNSAAVFKKLFKTIELCEPMFQSVVVLYRNKVEDSLLEKAARKAAQVVLDQDLKKTDSSAPPQSPASPFQQNLERRNIHIRRYEDIPLADTEIIFPDKKIYIKPITVIQLFITILGGIVAALVTLWNEQSSWTVMGSVITLLAGRAYQVYYSASLQKQRIQDAMTQGLYEKTRDSQEGVLYLLLEEMTDQHVKEVLLAFVVLMQSGSGLTEEQLDERCEAYLERRFRVRIDFAISQSLVYLVDDGIVRKDAQGVLTAAPLEEAVGILQNKWQTYFKSSEPWPVKHSKLARITTRQSNDTIPEHKVDKKVVESIFEDGGNGSTQQSAAGSIDGVQAPPSAPGAGASSTRNSVSAAKKRFSTMIRQAGTGASGQASQ